VQLVLDKIAEFKAAIHGVVLVGGPALEAKTIMNRHYGYINVLSRSASTVLAEAERQRIQTTLGLPTALRIYGGHEYLQAHPETDAVSLEQLWLSKKSQKLRSGFYIQSYQAGAENFVLVNGFHPAQLAHFTGADRRIVLILLHSNTDWRILRNEMVGLTFPEKATPGSIRGTLYAHSGQYGFESVTIANNGVHLSAGPVECVFEIMNFFGRLLDLNPAQQTPLLLRRLLQRGLSLEQALRVVENPPVTSNGKTTDLFSATEDWDTPDAVELWLKQK